MPRLESFSDRIDYGDRAHGRRPTLGEVLHHRARQGMGGEASEADVLKFFKMSKPAIVTMADFNAWQKRIKDLRGRMVSIEDTLGEWTFKDAANYVRRIIAVYGPPSTLNDRMAWWGPLGSFSEVYVKDESIPHNYPTAHMDFVYSTIGMDVPADKQRVLAGVTGSIIIDGLKREVTARCGKLIKNAVTLGFVQDVVGGSVSASKASAEYARRIKANITPEWYQDEMKESSRR